MWNRSVVAEQKLEVVVTAVGCRPVVCTCIWEWFQYDIMWALVTVLRRSARCHHARLHWLSRTWTYMGRCSALQRHCRAPTLTSLYLLHKVRHHFIAFHRRQHHDCHHSRLRFCYCQWHRMCDFRVLQNRSQLNFADVHVFLSWSCGSWHVKTNWCMAGWLAKWMADSHCSESIKCPQLKLSMQVQFVRGRCPYLYKFRFRFYYNCSQKAKNQSAALWIRVKQSNTLQYLYSI